MKSDTLLNRIISIEKGSDTEKCLDRYLKEKEEKQCLYSNLDLGCSDYRFISIRTEEEFYYFIRHISKENHKNNEDEMLVNKRVRLIDKNSPLGELETAQLREAESRASGDISEAYTIVEDEYFIKISTSLTGTSDVLSELILFSKLIEEDRKRLITKDKVRQQKTVIKKGIAPQR